MLPIIRRIRHPLVPEVTVPQTVAAIPESVAPPLPTPVPASHPVKTEKRTDSGQFCSETFTSDLCPPVSGTPVPPVAPSLGTGHSTAKAPCSRCRCRPLAADHCPQSSPSPLPAPTLWSRQPDESPEDYLLFAAWLELPVPRPSRKPAAKVLGCSYRRLSQRYVRHRWRVRTLAFDQHRADAASRALNELLRQETKDWRERAENFRLQEWLLHEEMFQIAFDAVRAYQRRPRSASLKTIAALLELASRLGRRAAGMPLDPAEAPPEPPALDAEWEAALRKVYGSDETAQIHPRHPSSGNQAQPAPPQRTDDLSRITDHVSPPEISCANRGEVAIVRP